MKKLRIKRKSLGLRAFLASLVVSLSVLLLLSLFLLVWFRNEMTGGYRELTETTLEIRTLHSVKAYRKTRI